MDTSDDFNEQMRRSQDSNFRYIRPQKPIPLYINGVPMAGWDDLTGEAADRRPAKTGTTVRDKMFWVETLPVFDPKGLQLGVLTTRTPILRKVAGLDATEQNALDAEFTPTAKMDNHAPSVVDAMSRLGD